MSKVYLLITADKYEHVLYSTRKLIDIIQFMPLRDVGNKMHICSNLCNSIHRNSITDSIFGKCKIISLDLKIELEDIIYQYKHQDENYLLSWFEIKEIAEYLGINKRIMYRYQAENRLNELLLYEINKFVKEVKYGTSMGQNDK